MRPLQMGGLSLTYPLERVNRLFVISITPTLLAHSESQLVPWHGL